MQYGGKQDVLLLSDDEPYDAVVIGAMSKVLVKGLDNLVPIQEDESGPR